MEGKIKLLWPLELTGEISMALMKLIIFIFFNYETSNLILICTYLAAIYAKNPKYSYTKNFGKYLLCTIFNYMYSLCYTLFEATKVEFDIGLYVFGIFPPIS